MNSSEMMEALLTEGVLDKIKGFFSKPQATQRFQYVTKEQWVKAMDNDPRLVNLIANYRGQEMSNAGVFRSVAVDVGRLLDMVGSPLGKTLVQMVKKALHPQLPPKEKAQILAQAATMYRSIIADADQIRSVRGGQRRRMGESFDKKLDGALIRLEN